MKKIQKILIIALIVAIILPAFCLKVDAAKVIEKNGVTITKISNPDKGQREVDGLVAAIEGLDAMTKAADVRVVHTEKRLGGRLVTFIVTGEISAVKAAVEAGVQSASVLGGIYGSAVIARPHAELTKFFDMEG